MSVTVAIVLITCLISYQAFQKPFWVNRLAHHPYSVRQNKEYYRLLTCGFIHGSWIHLLINMFVLYQFGEYIEYAYSQIWGPVWGRVLYVLMYLLTIIIANIPSQLQKSDDPSYFSVGASGGVSGIVFIFIIFHPWEKIYLYFAIGIYAIVAGILYLAYSHWASRNSNDRVDHSAHFFGALAGVAITFILKPSLIELFLYQLKAGYPF